MSNELNLVSEETFVDQTDKIATAITAAGGGTVDTEMSDTSTNAVQNKVIKEYVDDNSHAPLIINMSISGNAFVGDKTFGEAYEAAANNQFVIVHIAVADTFAQIMLFEINKRGSTIGAAYVDYDTETVKKLSGTANEYPTITLGN